MDNTLVRGAIKAREERQFRCADPSPLRKPLLSLFPLPVYEIVVEDLRARSPVQRSPPVDTKSRKSSLDRNEREEWKKKKAGSPADIRVRVKKTFIR